MVFLRLSAKGGATIDVLDETMAQSLLDQLFLDGKATGKTIISLHDELEKMSHPQSNPFHSKGVGMEGSHFEGDERCFGAILDHLAAKNDHGDFVANEKLETGEFNDVVSARLYELETQVKQLIMVKTFGTQFAKQNARIQQCEKIMKELNLASWRDTLEKQAATAGKTKPTESIEGRI